MILEAITHPVSSAITSSLPDLGTPPDGITQLKLWLDASDITTITQSANKVSQWSDKSGQGNHVAQASSVNQPITNTRTINGKNVIDWNGSTTFMDRGSYNGGPTSGPTTVIIVYEVNDVANTVNKTLLSTAVGQPGLQYLLNPNDKLLLFSLFSPGYFSATDVTPLTPIITQTKFDGVNGQTLRNGQPDGAGDAGSTMSGIRIAAESQPTPNPGTYWNGAIAEIIVYDKGLNTQETEGLTAYLKAKWGI